MPGDNEYQALMSEVIAKQAVILGPDIAIAKARNVEGLSVEPDGRVSAVAGDPKRTLQNLLDEYVALSGEIVRTALSSVFERYPNLDIETPKPL